MANWCHEYDFTAGTQGFTSSPAGRAVHVMNSGWQATASNCELIQLQSPTFLSTFIQTIEAYLTFAGAPRSQFKVRIPNVNSTPDVASVVPASVPSVLNINRTATTFGISFDNDRQVQGCQTPYSGFLTKLIIRGTGTNPFVSSYAVQPTGGGETVYLYRVPITENPLEGSFTTSFGVPIMIDNYAIDPLNRHLWLHSAGGWFKTTAVDRTNGTVLKPSGSGCIQRVEDANYSLT